MSGIDKEIAPSSLPDLILGVFGRDHASDRNTGLGSDGTSSAVEYPANQTSAGKTK